MEKKCSRKLIPYILISALLTAAALSGCSEKTEETAAQTQPSQEAQTTQAATAETKAEEETKALTNAEVANFTFTRNNFPVLDGSTSMVPLGKAVASALLGESPEDVAGLISFNRTTQSFRNLKDGFCDLLIVGEPNAAVFEEMKEAGFEYDLEEIATDGLIFVVNQNNPVDNLTTQQIKDIYSGKITNWKEVGGNDAPIVPFQRNEGAGSQALIKKLIMKETPMTEAPSTLIASEMGELMESVKSYDNSANAIGYSVYYYANDMKKAQGLKIISVDGVEPCAETIRTRKYPHLNAYYCVIDHQKPADSPARVLYHWMMSKDGQELVAAEGYVAAGDPETLKTELPGGIIVKTDYSYYRKLATPENKYSRLSEGELTELTAREDYGFLYPYAGSLNFVDSEDGYAYEAGALKGFFDENGRLVTDPVYNDIYAPGYYESDTDIWKTVPIWAFTRIKGEDIAEHSFATMDGSFVCDRWYETVLPNEDRIICMYNGYSAFDVYDLKGKKVLTQEDVKFWQTNEDWPGNIEYGNGFYVITTSEENTYYLSEKDRRILGPYTYGLNFRDGTAVAADPKDREYPYSLGVINSIGRWIIEPVYEQIQRLRNGNFLCLMPDGVYAIHSKTGALLNKVEAEDVSLTNFGFVAENSYYSEDDEEEDFRCFDFEGNLVFEDPGKEWKTAGKDGLIYRTMGAGVMLKNIFSGKKLYVEGAEEASSFYRLEDSPDVGRVNARNSYYEEESGDFYTHEWVFDNDLNLLFEKKGETLILESDEYSGEWYFMSWINDSRVMVRDMDFLDVGEFDGYPQVVNGKFLVTDSFASTCYDENGEVLFRYSLLTSQGD